jgi:DNA-binding MarR family transcriptional regulator
MVEGRGKHKKPELDRVIHEPARLQIISYLATAGPEVSFTKIGRKLDLTAGNLSVQLKRLEEAGYLTIDKSFKDNRPLTSVTITRAGMEALKNYLDELENMIGRLKTAMPDR